MATKPAKAEGKVVEIRPPRKRPGEPAPDMTPAVEDAMLASAPSSELSDVLAEVGNGARPGSAEVDFESRSPATGRPPTGPAASREIGREETR